MESKRYSGTIEGGSGYAAVLGFRTVNIPLTDESIEGAYAARVTVKEGEEPYMAAAFANQRRKVLEAHLLDFPAGGGSASGGNDDLGGLSITIELFDKIRETKKFDTEPQLRAAIADDVEKVRAYFKKS